MIDTPVPPTAPTPAQTIPILGGTSLVQPEPSTITANVGSYTIGPPAPADLNSLLMAQLAPVAVQAAEHAVAVVADATTAIQVNVDAKHADSLALITGLQNTVTGLAADVFANKTAIEAAVGRVG